MKVSICFFTGYRTRFGSRKEMILKESETLGDLLHKLALNPDDVGIMMLNGKNVSADAELHQGDAISLFQHMAGG